MLDQQNIVSGMMLMVDKPMGWTSFDVVNKIRFVIKNTFQLKKIKVGHAGTLDPMATGLLILCTGKMTKKISLYQEQHKTYCGSMRLGATTPSYDKETDIDHFFEYEHVNEDFLHETAQKMSGILLQTPPIFSAIKKDGIPLYKHARAGRTDIDVPKRRVEILRFYLTKIALPHVDFEVICSKGTYIRSLVHDFGKAVNSGAYLTSLTRTGIGGYQLREAWQLDDLIMAIKECSE